MYSCLIGQHSPLSTTAVVCCYISWKLPELSLEQLHFAQIVLSSLDLSACPGVMKMLVHMGLRLTVCSVIREMRSRVKSPCSCLQVIEHGNRHSHNMLTSFPIIPHSKSGIQTPVQTQSLFKLQTVKFSGGTGSSMPNSVWEQPVHKQCFK